MYAIPSWLHCKKCNTIFNHKTVHYIVALQMLFHWCTKDNKENAIKLKSICPLPLNSNKNNNVLFLKQKSPYTPTYGYFECLSGFFGFFLAVVLILYWSTFHLKPNYSQSVSCKCGKSKCFTRMFSWKEKLFLGGKAVKAMEQFVYEL
jgi:hypothetical protein